MSLEFKGNNEMSLEFKKINNEGACAGILAEGLATLLKSGKKVLWLIPGGSNIKIAVDAMNLIRAQQNIDLGNLSITLTDERYGPVGHVDSNWQQLLAAGLNLDKIKNSPVLRGLSLLETIQNYTEEMEKLFTETEVVVGQFGIGADGHIAGVLPGTIGAESQEIVVGYEAPPYTRITLTLEALKKINKAFVFAFGANKKLALQSLKQDAFTPAPAQILKSIPQVEIYTDQDL